MKKNYSTADMQLVSNTTGLSPSPVETLTALKTKRAIRQSYSASDLNSMDTLPSIDLCMYLLRLKCKTRKLNLDTRRPSYMEWRADLKRYRSESMYDQDSNRGVPNDEDFKKINTSLNWIREELVKMRKQDQDLARQFLSIHSDIQELRLEWSWRCHELTLQNAVMDFQEVDEIKRISDLPLVTDTEMALLDIGLTKMNLCHRKYSVM
ncbi:protein FAM167A-like [Ostrea edulis]|uniref:protein FAM167A-like n=1 Tax=Ostrea edulis TaxID=37623 RepID=UPI0024AFAC2C|nr:protein FAM167A-like [Ostrea edulis]